MDWTSIYEESGVEEFALPEHIGKPRLSRLVSAIYHHPHPPEKRRGATRAATARRGSSRLSEDGGDYASHRLFVLSSAHEVLDEGGGGDDGDGTDERVNDDDDGGEEEEEEEYSSYTLGALYCLSINYILGVGCLGVPYAFARAGFVLCGTIVLSVTVMSLMTVMWVAEAGVRAEAEVRTLTEDGAASGEGRMLEEDGIARERLAAAQSDDVDVKSQKEMPIHLEVDASDVPPPQLSEATSLIRGHHHTTVSRKRPAAQITFDPDQYEVIDLVSHYLGPVHSTLYQIALMALMYVGLLAYSQVFCGSVAALLPIDNDGQSSCWGAILPQLVFGIVVVPLSCSELDEQVTLQAVMAIVRFVAIFIMVGGSALALFLDDENSGQDSDRGVPPYFAPPEPSEMSYTACFSGFGVAFSTALFSQLFQHSVPGLVRPLRGRIDKVSKVPFVFGASLLTTCTFYMILGMTAASYFGADTLSSVNLNFANFSYGLKPHTTPALILEVCKVASNIVVMFPALDTLSVFPLIANTLGSNLLAASSPGFVRWIRKRLDKWDRRSCEGKKKAMARASRIATIFWRLFAALPPLLGSIWATDLSFSLLLAGVAGVYVAFFAPSLLQIYSCRRVDEERLTIYSGWYSRTELTYIVLLFAVFALGVVLVQIREAWIDMRST